MIKKTVMVSFYNKGNLGGPSNAMRKIMASHLQEKYQFVPIYLTDKLGRLFRVSVFRRLIKEIKQTKPDIIYFTGLQLHGFYIALASLLAGYKHRTVMVVRGSSCDAINFGGASRWLFRYILEPFSLRKTEITHTVCTEMANNPLIKKNVNRFGGVIYNMAPEICEADYNRETFRQEIGAKADNVILAYTGRIIEDKGIGYLLEAMKGTSDNTILVLVGDGNMRSEYEALCRKYAIVNRVFFLGARNDVLSILAGSDIYVFPTLHENLSNSLLEACRMCLPVIATNVGGNPEVIRNDEEGLLIPAMDSNALRDAINMLTDDAELRKKYGSNGKRRMLEVFSSKIIGEHIGLLFDEIVSN